MNSNLASTRFKSNLLQIFQKKKKHAPFAHLQKGCDIFSALDMMENQSFLEQLKFSISDKSLHFYLYNWMCPNMSPDKVLQPHLLVRPWTLLV